VLTQFGEELVDCYRDLEQEFGTIAIRRLQTISASVALRTSLKDPAAGRAPARRI
jgi:hypothetical protein